MNSTESQSELDHDLSPQFKKDMARLSAIAAEMKTGVQKLSDDDLKLLRKYQEILNYPQGQLDKSVLYVRELVRVLCEFPQGYLRVSDNYATNLRISMDMPTMAQRYRYLGKLPSTFKQLT